MTIVREQQGIHGEAFVGDLGVLWPVASPVGVLGDHGKGLLQRGGATCASLVSLTSAITAGEARTSWRLCV